MPEGGGGIWALLRKVEKNTFFWHFLEPFSKAENHFYIINDALLRVEASVKTLYTNCPYKSSKQNIMIVHPNHHTMFVQNASARAMSRYVVRELRLIGQNEKKFRFRQKTGPWTGGTDGTRVRSRTAVVRSRAPSIVSDWQFTESVEKTLLIVVQNSCFQVNNSAVTKNIQ